MVVVPWWVAMRSERESWAGGGVGGRIVMRGIGRGDLLVCLGVGCGWWGGGGEAFLPCEGLKRWVSFMVGVGVGVGVVVGFGFGGMESD